MNLLAPLACLCLAAPWAAAESPFASLARRCVEAREGRATVRILHFGDSHLASGGQAAALRTLLRNRFGDGGPGFGLPWAGLGLPGITAGATPGWRRSLPSFRTQSDGLAGPSGAHLEALRGGERAWLEGPFRQTRVYLLRQPGGGKLRLRIDGRPAGPVVDLDGPPEVLRLAPEVLGAQARRLELATEGRGLVRVLGIALERGPGVVYSALGHNGATASALLRVQEAAVQRILQGEAPDLVILAYGTNEASLRDFTPQGCRADFQALLERLRRILPGAAILLAGPPDADLPRGGTEALAQVGLLQRDLATQRGALFVDQRAAMGGAGAIHAWQRAGLAARDRIHFTVEGYTRLARTTLETLYRRLGAEAEGLEPARAAFAPPEPLGRLPASALPGPDSAVAAATGRPIYTFRTEEGRLIITDDPRSLQGQKGQWLGTRPGG